MGEFFRFMVRSFYARRQKNGAVTLVTSLFLMVGWITSYSNQIDILLGCIGDESQHLRSRDGAIRWVYRVWSRINDVREEELFWIPYWSVVVPLTLSSAYLLISMPRKSNQKKTAEPIPAEAS